MMSLENFVPRQAAERLRAGGRPRCAGYLRRVFLLGGLPVAALPDGCDLRGPTTV